MIHSGQPVKDFIETATRHVQLKQGMLGVKVKIMRDPAADAKVGSPSPLFPILSSSTLLRKTTSLLTPLSFLTLRKTSLKNPLLKLLKPLLSNK